MNNMFKIILLFLCFVSFLDSEADTAEENVKKVALSVAQDLRDRYSITQSVYLTIEVARLSSAFMSNEQSNAQWVSVLSGVEEIASIENFTTINSSALSGQILIANTNGMTLDKWRSVHINKHKTVDDLQRKLTESEYFSIYVQLADYWQLILASVDTDNDLNWYEDLVPDIENVNPHESDNDVSSSILSQVLNFLLQPEQELLSDFLNRQDSHYLIYDTISVALLRLDYHKKNNQVMASIYDWIDIYQQLEFSKQLIPVTEQKKILQLIKLFRDWYSDQNNPLEQFDIRVESLLNGLFSGIEKKFQNPDYFDDQVNQLIIQYITDIEDMELYFKQPIRASIQKSLEVCLNISGEFPPYPQQPIEQDQFLGCVEDMVNWGAASALMPELSGAEQALDSTKTILRALDLPAFQIINTLRLFRNQGVCEQQHSVVNPLEWMLATESLLWLKDRWPPLFKNEKIHDQLKNLLAAGQKLQMSHVCRLSESTLASSYQKLIMAWGRVKEEVSEYAERFVTSRIKKGHSIDFFQPTNQYTSLRAEDYQVTPCENANTCGAIIELPVSSEFLNQFPNHIRQAVVLGLGNIKLCYDDVEWVERSTVATHLNNDKISNYQGRLSFRLKGLYKDKLVFDKKVSTTKTYHYLFAENNRDVLAMSCPLSIIGKQIQTSLDRGTFGLVPNRLTFLTASRADVNQIITNNWSSGDEWLLKLSNENASELLYYDAIGEIESVVNSYFVELGNQLQETIYQQLMDDKLRRYNSSPITAALMDYLAERDLFYSMLVALYPDYFHQQPIIREVLTGNARIPDRPLVEQAFNKKVYILDMLNVFEKRLFDYQNILPIPQNKNQYGMLRISINKLDELVSSVVDK